LRSVAGVADRTRFRGSNTSADIARCRDLSGGGRVGLPGERQIRRDEIGDAGATIAVLAGVPLAASASGADPLLNHHLGLLVPICFQALLWPGLCKAPGAFCLSLSGRQSAAVPLLLRPSIWPFLVLAASRANRAIGTAKNDLPSNFMDACLLIGLSSIRHRDDNSGAGIVIDRRFAGLCRNAP
jgi:hypothetical protein